MTQNLSQPPITEGLYNDQAVILVSRSEGDPQPVQLEDGKTIVGDASSPDGYSQVEVGGGGGGGVTAQFSWIDNTGVVLASEASAMLDFADLDVTAAYGTGVTINDDDSTFLDFEPGIYYVSVVSQPVLSAGSVASCSSQLTPGTVGQLFAGNFIFLEGESGGGNVAATSGTFPVTVLSQFGPIQISNPAGTEHSATFYTAITVTRLGDIPS